VDEWRKGIVICMEIWWFKKTDETKDNTEKISASTRCHYDDDGD